MILNDCLDQCAPPRRGRQGRVCYVEEVTSQQGCALIRNYGFEFETDTVLEIYELCGMKE